MVKKTQLLYLCVLLVLSVGNTDGQYFRYDYDYYPEVQGWLKLHQIPATWSDARLLCKQEGSVLASPEDENMLVAIRTAVKSLQEGQKIFTGVHATYAKGHYYSIGGTPLERLPVHWAAGEPNNAGNMEQCLAMLLDGKMADVICRDVLPFVCFKRQTTDMEITRCGTVDKDYKFDHRTNSCYKFHTDPQNWSNAFATCSAEGGYLAIINSEIESQVLAELYEKTNASLTKHIFSNVLLGFTDWKDHGTWMTIQGKTLKEAGFDKWEGVQPDNDSCHCGGMFEFGLLDDLPCDEPRIFICEMDPTDADGSGSTTSTNNDDIFINNENNVDDEYAANNFAANI